jgi:uncharacterized protein (DUF1800 family)
LPELLASGEIRRSPDRTTFSRAEVAHLLRRAGFGGRNDEIDRLSALGSWEEVVETVLDTSANPPDPIPAAVDDRARERYDAWMAGAYAWLDRMATTPTPLVEKVTLFWHSNLATSSEAILPRLVVRQIQTYRALGLGDVHELLQAMAVDPAMLQYLDNASNVAGGPNENFARELLELFVLGPESFTEADVKAMARAWTGHGLDADDERYQWHPDQHDDRPTTLFGITRRWNGPEAITEIVRGSQQRSCARFLAAKLWSSFAAPDPPEAIVNELADTFVASGMVVRDVLRAIFLHPEFRSPATRTALVRSPIEWIVLAMRSTGLTAAELHPEWYLARLGQIIYQPPNVAGWRQNSAWITTSALSAKGSFVEYARWRARNAGVLAATADLPPVDAVQAAFDQFGIDNPSPMTRRQLEAYVAGEQAAGRREFIPPNLVALTLLSPDAQLA